ncbi:uncharacterized protein M421DRAFT_296089 [Didymella exigua CBS 183.55]|uniref:Uncharacterized protein n=1 Tax=Didymella exigua CBS 183.55 TaxID=1150837 RepID=A0A6A5RAS4_9PLEO|nr:uncharacterized protein M421DRAFT_296089 [Didymella exigua CBS 183.55]KAF1924164.1 hypothetical protein M421DRAFT_296089 [Didymella exigua CBS 183.55]
MRKEATTVSQRYSRWAFLRHCDCLSSSHTTASPVYLSWAILLHFHFIFLSTLKPHLAIVRSFAITSTYLLVQACLIASMSNCKPAAPLFPEQYSHPSRQAIIHAYKTRQRRVPRRPHLQHPHPREEEQPAGSQRHPEHRRCVHRYRIRR